MAPKSNSAPRLDSQIDAEEIKTGAQGISNNAAPLSDESLCKRCKRNGKEREARAAGFFGLPTSTNWGPSRAYRYHLQKIAVYDAQ